MVHAVLVVEDEPDLVSTYGRLLRHHGYRMTAAKSRREGLAALESETFVLVIADIRLADGDGLDVVRAARAQAKAPPVIVVTGFASAQSRRQALEAGATAYLAKPFSTVVLASLIQGTITPPAP